MKGNEGDNMFFSTSVEVLVGAQQDLLGAPTDRVKKNDLNMTKPHIPLQH